MYIAAVDRAAVLMAEVRVTARSGVGGLALVVVLAAVSGACTLSGSKDLGAPTTLPSTTASTPVAVKASAECRTAFQQGHDGEAAGTETFVAFRPSVQRCTSLAEWIGAARAIGVDLGGQASAFVDRTCSMADDATRARAICQEVKGQDR